MSRRLEPAEVPIYTAIELPKALDTADALGEAGLAGRKAAPTNIALSDLKIAFATTILRCEGRPDRESRHIGRARG
ncbi:MAG: hypothetical protein KF730_11650 [Sphingomonas sp.]|uniref:hypothetical protein n=1 Tax=Sphingomonas sp. TaxID=28214 RepID=UPI0025E639E4|nr:hypothetical protein [Sphingomonas sp.]MBX3565214.1 hypothetical protein [Sphingomonas sp.]